MPQHDVDLTDHDLAGLRNRDAVKTLFAKLGFKVERGRPTDPVAEGMNEKLAEGIRHIEVVAADPDDFVAVYLIECPTVTVDRINKLATHFKNRAGDSVAVLTADYQRLDFVLFDRQLVRDGAPARMAQVVPRRLIYDQDERDEGRKVVIRRALRRFTWTEPDGVAQWEKLRSAFAIGEWSERYFDNRGLFSDYYLSKRLPDHDEWRQAEGLRAKLNDVRVAMLDARQRFAAEPDEAELRDGLLEPLFASLGFEPVKLKDPASQDHETPDYQLRDPATGQPLAVCLTYHWDRFLDGPETSDTDPTAAENPGAAVLSILDHEGVDWAIVTNGKHWRLYTSKTASRATNFFQLDLEEAAADSDPTALRYFWLLFRAEAFRLRAVPVDGATRERSFLQDLLEGSREYAQAVGDRLKERVFEDVFPILAEGFIDDLRRKGEPTNDAALRQVFDATLTLLYRLLFLLYAESRDLLPVREPGGYWERSLSCIKTQVGTAAGTVESQRDSRLAERYTADAFESWGHLRRLFNAIDVGEAGLNVPPYNGGLFATDPASLTDAREVATARFLAEHQVSDLHLAKALDRIARDPDDKTHGLVFIDFKSLGVRQLGSIYEGLLEFQVKVAEERMAVCTRSGSELILPLAEARSSRGVTIQTLGRGRSAPEWIIEKGAVYLTNSKLERKASGSYYTPEDLVAYIVEHTVGPVLAAKLEGLRNDLNQACGAFLRRKKAGAGEDFTEEDRQLVQRLFDFRVLDPAMGSGHFLVSAVDFIADRLIDYLNGFPGNPVERLVRRTRAEIVAAAADQGVIIDETKLIDVNVLKRHVLKRCLFGVDLNPMAVELAKVSLWLHCFTLGAPLSFLGHHFKIGNSLVGEIDAGKVIAPGSTRWGQLQLVIGRYLAVSQRADATAAEVAASRTDYRAAEEILERDRRRAHCETARHFEGWSPTDVGQIQRIADGGEQPGYQAEFERAMELADEVGFYHWPLEFPEAWFEPHGRFGGAYRPKEEPGFDVVVGNPPWDKIEPDENQYVIAARPEYGRLSAPERKRRLANDVEWLERVDAIGRLRAYVGKSGRYPLMSSGRANYYMMFAELASRTIWAGGRFGLLLPSGIATDYSTRAFFGGMVDAGAVAGILDFENRLGIFPEVDSRFKLTVFLGSGPSARIESIPCGFFLHRLDEAEQPGRVIQLQPDDFRLMNPNTLTCPVLRHQRDADLIRGIYRRLGILALGGTRAGGASPWRVTYKQGTHNMTSDASSFVSGADLLTRGFTPDGPHRLVRKGQTYLALYEGKMIHQFDHRFASVLGFVDSQRPIGASETTSPDAHQDPHCVVDGRYWVPQSEVLASFGHAAPRFLLAFRDVARATDERTAICAVCPLTGMGNTAPLFLVVDGAPDAAVLLAWFCSLVNDYVIRQKICSTHLNWFYVEQQPVPSPDQVRAIAAGGDTFAWIAERVLELSYTAWDLKGFAEDLSYDGEPFRWDEERRIHLRAQLDALFFHLYGLGPDDIDYIAETFWIVRRNEEAKWGRYRSKELILAYWRAYERGEWNVWLEAR